jgi:hypothetical protein
MIFLTRRFFQKDKKRMFLMDDLYYVLISS